MPTVSQHYGHHAASWADDRALATRQTAAPVVLMVSGGADSTALLLMACTSKLDILDGRGVAPIARERLHVLHVNHHLRGEASDGDEAFVRGLCAQYGLPLCVEHAYFDDESGNIEAAAREVRYAAARRYVRELCVQTGAPRTAARICTAHTSSDRAETFLMNAIKGSGPAGLSSIPRRRNIVVRPLLDLTHDELVGYLQVHGQPWREDESNEDVSYLRNYVRHRVMPVVAQRNASVCKTIGAACEILGDEDAFLSQLSAQAFRSCLRKEAAGALVLDARRLAAAEVVIARRMVRLAIKRIDPDARPEMRHVERVIYPGLESHPTHEIAKKQMHGGFGGMMSVDIKGGMDAVRIVMNNVKVFSLATSLGNVDSLIQHSPSMSHFDMTPEERYASEIYDGQVRLSIGIEDADDLIADLDQALALI